LEVGKLLSDLIQSDGILLKRQAVTNGGEYAGPCPFCRDGNDRFRVWLEKDRYWCRQCGKSGDAIQYLRDVRGMDFKAAAEVVGRVVSLKIQHKTKPVFREWKPADLMPPSTAWQQRAKKILLRSQQVLWSDEGKASRERLAIQRCLGEDAIQRHGLGLIPVNVFENKQIWGQGEGKLSLPAGIVIPCWRDNQLVRLRIRQSNPDTNHKYWTVAGSVGAPLIIDNGRDAATIVESDLDAILIDQEASNLVSVISLGSCSIKPDSTTHSLLRKSKRIAVSLDYDKAGRDASAWWLKHYKQAKKVFTPEGKDPGDFAVLGGPVGLWVKVAIE